MSASSKPVARRALALLTIVAAPAALGLETLLRVLLFPPDFAAVRDALSPLLTPVVWLIVGLAIFAAIGGFFLQGHLAGRAIKRLPESRRDDPQEREKAMTGAFMLAASVPQIPAVIATFAFTFGSSFAPVAATMIVSTLGVIVQVARAFRL